MTRAACVLLALVATACAARAANAPLGAPPLCEPSAALRAPWDPALVLVGDNEQESALFGFALRDGLLAGQHALALPAGGPHDVEALARFGNEIVVVGSHGRDRRCAVKPARRRIAFLAWDAAAARLVARAQIDGASALAAAAQGEAACLAALFVSPPPAGAQEACAAIVAAERDAAAGRGACATFNIEGAVALGTPPRLWLGLRAPVAAQGALLLRLADPRTALRFDAVATLPGAAGVRDIVLDGATLWIATGPPGDGARGFALASLPAAQLVPGARLAPVSRGSLPPSSEGLVIDGGGIVALIDGDRGAAAAARCAVGAAQVRVVLR